MSDEYIIAKYLRLSLEDGDLDDIKRREQQYL